MKSKKKPMIHFLRVLLAVMLGLMCALFAVIVSNVIFILWDSLTGLPDAGSVGGIIFDLQRLAAFLVFAALAGVLSILNLNKSRNDVIVSGAISGASMAIMLILSLALLAQDPARFYKMLYMSLPPYLIPPSAAEFTESFANNLNLIVAHAWLPMLVILLAATAVAAGAAYYSAYDKQGKPVKKLNKPAMVIGILVLAAVIVPAIIVAAGMGAGVISHPTSVNYIAIKTMNETSGNALIDFELVRSPGLRYLDQNRPFTLTIDGKEATNQSIADENGLNVALDPASGPGHTEGSKLRIKNLKASSKVEIIAHFTDGADKTILSY